VFNFLGSSGEFTQSPQLLLWVGCKEVSAKVILPNAAPARLWSKLGKWPWAGLMARVLKGMAPAMADCPGMEPRLILKQRHWQTRNGPSFRDAYLDVDLRTLGGYPGSDVKEQRDWIDAARGVVANKNSNFELQVGATFRYDHCPAIQTPDALNHVAAAWIGCRFFIEWLQPSTSSTRSACHPRRESALANPGLRHCRSGVWKPGLVEEDEIDIE